MTESAGGQGTTRRRFLALLATAGLAACGGGGSGSGSGGDGGGGGGDGSGGTGGGAEDSGDGADGRTVLALGEEYVLADLLALGVHPVASTTNVVLDEGFVGLDDVDTSGIEALSSTDPNLEHLAQYRADVVVSSTFAAEYLGRESLEALGGELVVVPDDDPVERLRILGDTFSASDEAEALISDLDEAVAAARETLGPNPGEVSVATVYPGPTVAVWVDGPTEVPAMLAELGFTLRPGPDDVEGEEDGRLYLSEERVDVLDADVLVSLQSSAVEGEDAALEAMADDVLWSRLPAVQAGNVVTIDRLGYPGITGRIRLVDDLVAQLG